MVLQTYLVFREPIFTPVDELEHTDYVRTIAETGRLPVYGSARIDPTLLAVYLHEYPGPFDTTHFNLPAVVYFDYEAVQFPVYYITAAPLYLIFHRDARVAIYVLRLQNVLYSAGLLLVLMLMLRLLFSGRPEVAALAPLTFLLMPGVSLRHSQVTNQVLAALLLAGAVCATAPERKDQPWAAGTGRRRPAGHRRDDQDHGLGRRPKPAHRLGDEGRRYPASAPSRSCGICDHDAAVAGVVAGRLPLPPPLGDHPPQRGHLQLRSPNSAAVWNAFVHALWVNFVLPFEWVGSSGACTPQCYAISPRSEIMKVGLVVAGVMTVAALGWALFALRRRGADTWRPALLALLALAGVATGIIGLDVSLNRFWSTDLREVYVFAAPMVLLLGGLAARFDRRWVMLVLGAMVILWLVIDYQIYTSTNCAGCPPSYFRIP